MAVKKFLTHIDLGKNELQNFLFQKLASAPSSPVEGQGYYDTTLKQFGVYQNAAWIYLSAANGANVSKASASGATGTLQVSGGTDRSIADYAPGSAGLVKVSAAGVPTLAVAKTDYAPATATTSSLKGDGSGGFAAATLNDNGTPTANFALGGFKLTNAADPTAAQDVSTKNYTDTSIGTASTADRARGNHTGTQTASTISDFDTQVRTSRLDQMAAPTAAVALNGQRITGLADPTSAQDAATKNYADTQQNAANTANRARANHTGTQLAATISDFDTQVRTSRLDQLAAPTTSVSLNSQRITGLADPTGPTDAVTKQYADGLAAGFDPKGSVRVATTAAGTLASSFTAGTVIDGYTLVSGDRILIKNQATASENGLYTVTAGTPTRTSDANTSALVTTGLMTYVENGTVNGGQIWILTTTGSITLGTTGLTFTQFSGSSTLTAGAGLAPSGNVFNVGAGNGILVNADNIQLDPAVGVRKFAQTIGDASAVSFTLTHNLGTQDITYSIRDTSTNELLDAQVVATSTTTATISFNSAPASNSLRVTIHG